MNRASASEIADQLLHDLTPVDPAAADALGMAPENVMPALAPADFATRREAYLRAHRSLDTLGMPMPAELVLATAPGFDPRAFHMRALRLGPLGIGPLREVMS